MISRQRARKEAAHLLQTLQELEHQIPQRFGRAAARLEPLRDRLTQVSQRWWPFWLDESQLDSIRAELGSLDRLVRRIRPFEESMTRLLDEIRSLKARAGESAAGDAADPEASLQGRCAKWHVELNALGARIGSEIELEAAWHTLRKIEEESRLAGETVQLLLEARGLLDRMPMEVREEAEPHRRDVGELESRFGREGASREVCDRLLALLPSLRQLANRPPPVEKAAQDYLGQIQLARFWADQLGEGGDAVEDLVKEYKISVAAWSPTAQDNAPPSLSADQVNEILRRLGALLDGLVRQAEEIRKEKRRRLDLYLAAFRRAGASLPTGFEDQLQDLEFMVDGPSRHSRWLGLCQRLSDSFRGHADADSTKLTDSLTQTLDRLRERRSELSQRPLFKRERALLEEVQHSLDLIELTDESDGILKAIIECEGLGDKLSEIEDSNRRTREKIEDQADRLKRRGARLSEVAEQFGAQIQIPTSLMERLSNFEGLDENACQRLADSIEEGLADQEAFLLEISRKKVGAKREFIARAKPALQELHKPIPDTGSAEAESAGDADLEGSLAELNRVSGWASQLSAALNESIKEMEERRSVIHSELKSNTRLRSFLGEDEIERFTQSYSDLTDPVARLERLARLVKDGESYLNSQPDHQRRLAQLRSSLDARCKEFVKEGFGLLSPRAPFERVRSLMAGLSEAPSDPVAALEQLQHAQRLLERLQAHARRRVARELEEAVQVLRRKNFEDDPEAEQERLSTLEKLAQTPDYEMPPAGLRKRTMELARRIGP